MRNRESSAQPRHLSLTPQRRPSLSHSRCQSADSAQSAAKMSVSEARARRQQQQPASLVSRRERRTQRDGGERKSSRVFCLFSSALLQQRHTYTTHTHSTHILHTYYTHTHTHARTLKDSLPLFLSPFLPPLPPLCPSSSFPPALFPPSPPLPMQGKRTRSYTMDMEASPPPPADDEASQYWAK